MTIPKTVTTEYSQFAACPAELARAFSELATQLSIEMAYQTGVRFREWYDALPEPRPALAQCEAVYQAGVEPCLLVDGQLSINPDALPTFRVVETPKDT